MAVVTFPDEILTEAGLTERDLPVEIACRLFDAGKVTLWSAAKLAGLDRGGMEDALLERGIPVYRPTLSDLADDLAALEHLESARDCPLRARPAGTIREEGS